MKLSDFNQLLNDRHNKGTLYDSNGHLKNDIIEQYIKNNENLKEEFFNGITQDLDQDNIRDLQKYAGILTVDPFDEVDKERFQKTVTLSIEKLESFNPSVDISDLANFVWVLLDHMLHNWTMTDEKLMISKLRDFKIGLKKFENVYKDEIELLYQKLEHFGVE